MNSFVVPTATTVFKVRVRLVMLVGVEGAGHHFLASIVYKAEGQVLYLKDWAADIFLTPSKVGS